ncbi:polyprenyl synthetase family protein [Halalkalicoccus subterraneus]|uniref:polyprenyl synthetase family protein n=1 Tax=Halalkalicoccus subterraneus TaxID=2675002 RepID=UPI0013CEAFD2|nr:polyprenyl synthetase family protein [Halalkalicoccus subterraneus]
MNDVTSLEAVVTEYSDRISAELDFLFANELPASLSEPIPYSIEPEEYRLRATLLLLVADTFEIEKDKTEDIIPAALAVELSYILSVAHDDVIKQSERRQGKPLVDTKQDQSIAILAGDALFPKALEILLETDAPAEDLIVCQRNLLRGCRHVFEGQMLSCSLNSHESATETTYLKMLRLKTGSLFASSAYIGAILAGKDTCIAHQLAEYGRHIGVAFHIYHNIRKVTREPDLAGTISSRNLEPVNIMTIHAHQYGVDVPALLEGTDEAYDSLISELKSVGSIAYAQDRVTEYVWIAQRSLNQLSEPLKEHHLYELGNAITDDFVTSYS